MLMLIHSNTFPYTPLFPIPFYSFSSLFNLEFSNNFILFMVSSNSESPNEFILFTAISYKLSAPIYCPSNLYNKRSHCCSRYITCPNTAPSPAPCNVLTAIFPTDFHGYYISVPVKTLYSRFWCFICHRFRITVLFL